MAYTKGQDVPAFGIALKPTFVSSRMTSFFGTTIEREAIKYNKGKPMKDFQEHLRIWTANAFKDLSLYTSHKVAQALDKGRDPTTGSKFKPLARKTVYARIMRGKSIEGVSKPLIETGKLYNVAAGSRLKNTSGNASSGSVSKDGIRLQQRVNYRLGETQVAGSFYWQLSGPKARHLYGYNEVFTNVVLKGPRAGKKKKYEAKVPARPFVPKFTNSYFQTWKKRMNADFVRAINATGTGSTAIVKSYGYVDKHK
jgi:hypothetical protein